MISIITSTYNRPKRLHRAIESVINQSYKDWELIIVDDGSKTDTKAVVDGFDDERIRLILRKENFGNDTRPKNEGILASKGEYICFLDDDCEYKKDHLKTLLGALEADKKLSGVYGDRIIYENDEMKGIGVYSEFDRSLLMRRNYIDTSDILLRREDLLDIGGFDEGYKKYIDWNLWVRFAKAGKEFKRVPRAITKYYIGKDNKSLRAEDTVDNKPAWDSLSCKVRQDYLGKQKPTKVAVFSLTYDRLEYTKECFKTLHDTAGYKFDHFVVDNGSKDGTQEWLKDNKMFKKIILNEDNKGISIASNQAVKEIRKGNYDVIVKVDNDAYFKTNGWLKKMVEIYESFPMIALSCYIEGLKDNPGGAPRADYITMADELIGLTQHVGGICHFVEARAYDGFEWDEKSFLHGVQDMELSAYLGIKGYLMGYLENYICSHGIDGTVAQHEKYKDYFERRKEEKRTRYDTNR